MRKQAVHIAAILGKCHKAGTESKPYGQMGKMGWMNVSFKGTPTLH